MNDLRSGNKKSRLRQLAVLCHEREHWSMEANQYRGESGLFGVPDLANETVDRSDQVPELDRRVPNRVFQAGPLPSRTDAAAIGSRGPFPLRTLMVCFTIWLIATQAMIFDEIKFETRVHLLEQEARSLGGSQVIIQNERPSNQSTGAKMQRL